MSDTSATRTSTAIVPDLVPGTWVIDEAHSSLEFEARHAMITKVRGRFAEFEGKAEIDENVTESSVQVTVDIKSIHTNNEQRDEHLRSSDFFAADRHPTMTFQSTGIRQAGDHWVLEGDLTVRGSTQKVEFDLEFNGVTKDPFGQTRAGFSASTTVNRKAWGLEWNVPLDAGGFLVSDKVKVSVEAALVLQEDEAAR